MQFLENVKLEPLGCVRVRVTSKLTSDWTMDNDSKFVAKVMWDQPRRKQNCCCSDTELFAANNFFLFLLLLFVCHKSLDLKLF